MPGQVRLAALRAFIRPTKNLCSNRCRDGMSAVPLCLNPPAGVPLKAGNGGARPRLLPPFRRFRAATRGCIRMRPEQGACSRRHPSLQLRSATYSPGHRFFRSDGFRHAYRMRFDLSIYFPSSRPRCQPANPCIRADFQGERPRPHRPWGARDDQSQASASFRGKTPPIRTGLPAGPVRDVPAAGPGRAASRAMSDP
jgi:hypothetical protein